MLIQGTQKLAPNPQLDPLVEPASSAARRLPHVHLTRRWTREWEMFAVGLLFLALAGWRIALSLLTGGPTVFGDETLYYRNAHSLATLEPYYSVHFPPLYSATLAPAFWFGLADPWRAALVISAIVGAAVVPATYWLARTAGARRPLAATALCAALVGASAYSQHLMSESLGVPLVVIVVTLALRGRRTPPILMGLAVAALCLTRYIYFPLAIVLPATWLWMRNRGVLEGERVTRPAENSWRSLLSFALTYVAALSAWLVYAVATGSSIERATGADTFVGSSPTSGHSESIVGTGSLWLGLYVSYVIIACVPIVLVASWLILSRGAYGRFIGAFRSRAVSPRAALLVTSAVMTAGYVAISTRHSLVSYYNLPEPSHYMARYLMHLVPLLTVAAVVGLDIVLETSPSIRSWRLWAGAIVAAVVVYAGFEALFGPVFDRYHELWGMTFHVLSPDTFSLGTPQMLGVLLGLIAVSTVLVAVRWRLSTLLVWIAVAALGTAASFGVFHRSEGSTPHKIADLVHGQNPAAGRVVVCVGPGIVVPTEGAADFWQVPNDDLVGLDRGAAGNVSSWLARCRAATTRDVGDTVLLVTSESGGIKPTLVDKRWGSSMYVYRV